MHHFEMKNGVLHAEGLSVPELVERVLPQVPGDRGRHVLDRGLQGDVEVHRERRQTGDAAVPEPTSGPTFTDVADDFWAYKHVEHCAAEGVAAGYDDGSYRPGGRVTRDQMAVYVTRAFGLSM